MAHRLENILLRLLQVIIDDDRIKLRGETHFIFRFLEAHLDGFCRFGTSIFQTLTECRYRRGLNEDRQTAIGIMTFEIECPFHIDVTDHVLSGGQLALHRSEQRAVEAIGVDFFVFEKFAGGDAATELFRSEEKVFDAVTFRPARGTTGGADREMQVEASGDEVFDERIFVSLSL